MDHSTDQSMDYSADQSMDYSADQSMDYSTDQSMDYPYGPGPPQKWNKNNKERFHLRVYNRSLVCLPSHLPSVAESGYKKCVFRSFKLVCICNFPEQILKSRTSSRAHRRMG